MYFSLFDVVLLFVLGSACVYFLSSIRVKELDIQAVLHAARRDDFQLLDQSVHLRRLSLSRDTHGRWRVWRQYRFDYSYDGVQRLQGFVVMLGNVQQSVLVREPSSTLH